MNKKIFISHSHLDSDYAKIIIDFLEVIEVPSDRIFCTSIDGYGVPLGENFLTEIKKWLEDDVIVIFLLSENYYSSAFSMCEMGAAWIKAKNSYPILIPPFTIDKLKGVLNHNLAFYINDPKKLTLFRMQIENSFQIIDKITPLKWELFKENTLSLLQKKISNSKIKNTKINDYEDSCEPEILQLVNMKPGNFNRYHDGKEISVGYSFKISKHLITQELFKEVMEYNPCNTKGAKLPVENVSFFEALEFCNKLSAKEGFELIYKWNEEYEITISENVKGFRLPYEIEWDYALKYNKNAIEFNFDSMCWYVENSQNKTKEVGLKPDNLGEIFDMIGNVWEWCFDTYTIKPSYENNYKKFTNIKDSHVRVLKGGSFLDIKSTLLNNNFRMKLHEKSKEENCGFRIVLQNQNIVT